MPHRDGDLQIAWPYTGWARWAPTPPPTHAHYAHCVYPRPPTLALRRKTRHVSLSHASRNMGSPEPGQGSGSPGLETNLGMELNPQCETHRGMPNSSIIAAVNRELPYKQSRFLCCGGCPRTLGYRAVTKLLPKYSHTMISISSVHYW